MNLDHRQIAAAQSPRLDLGDAPLPSPNQDEEPPFLVLPSLRGATLPATGASRSAGTGAPEEPAAAASSLTPSKQSTDAAAAEISLSIQAIIAERRRQIEQFGHTPEKDLGARPMALLGEVQRCVSYARDDAHYHRPGWREACRRHLAQVGATAAAVIEYLDNGGGE